MSVSHINPMLKLSKVLRLRASAAMEAGQIGAAYKDVRLTLRLARSLEHEPNDMSLLVRISLQRNALNIIWEGLADHRWDAGQLRQLQQDLAADKLFPQLDLAIHGERCETQLIADLWQSNRLQVSWLIGRQPDLQAALILYLIPSGWLYLNCLNKELFEQRFIVSAIDFHAVRLNAARIETGEAALDDGHYLWHGVPYHVPERIQIRGCLSSFPAIGFGETSLRLGELACALERYRLEHGSYPAQLAALVPQFIAALPHDIMDGQPLRYRREGAGFVLYSIGWNQKDDSGKIATQTYSGSKSPLEHDKKNGDWVWRSQPAP